MKNQTNLTNNDLLNINKAIVKLGEEKIDLNTALELVAVQEIITKELQKHNKAIEMAVKFTKDEQEISKLMKELSNSITESNKDEVESKIKELETTHKDLLQSIKDKNEERNKIDKEIGEKPISITIKPCIDKNKLPSMYLWQTAVLKPLFK
jgi:phenylalanyl-tRNA synthetase alpha subunit